MLSRIKSVTHKRIRGFLMILLVMQCINLSLFLGLDKAQASLSDWMYQNYTEPFLK